jgi:ribosomal protein S1
MSKNEIYGNPELAYVFEEEEKSVKKGFKVKNVSDEVLAAYEAFDYRIPKSGDVVTAKYKSNNETEFLLGVDGYKDLIRVDNKGSEFKHFENLGENEEIQVLITMVDNNNFLIKGSVDAIQEQIARETISKLKRGDFVFGKILSMNPAGYDVEITQGTVTLAAFMPNTLAGINKLHDPSSIVGQEFEVAIESFSKSEGTYIVSRKKYLRGLIPEEISKLETGKVYSGHVTGTTPFGIFVEFNKCLTGLIHKVNVNDDWKDRLNEVKPGFEIEFYVKEVLPKNKIILTQILRESLWDTIETDMQIDGKVKSVKPFGVLVSLDEETVGLIPSSELKNKKSLKKGDDIKVKVLSADKTNRKISLSIV